VHADGDGRQRCHRVSRAARRAISLVVSGMTVATVLGVPLGTWIGVHFGWRATFVLVALLGAIALAGLLLGLPHGLPRNTATLGQRIASPVMAPCCMHWRSRCSGRSAASPSSPIWPYRCRASASARPKSALPCWCSLRRGDRQHARRQPRRPHWPVPTATFGLVLMMCSLTLLSVTLKFAAPGYAGPIFLILIFCWASPAGPSIRADRQSGADRTQASMIALSLNASRCISLRDRRRVGGHRAGDAVALGPRMGRRFSEAMALALVLFRRRREGLKLHKIAG